MRNIEVIIKLLIFSFMQLRYIISTKNEKLSITIKYILYIYIAILNHIFINNSYKNIKHIYINHKYFIHSITIALMLNK